METLVSCNLCSCEPLEGLCYRTRCRHFLCEACACNSFSSGTSCPICKCKLSEEEIYQITVGIRPVIEGDFLYQKVLQNPNWEQVLLNTNNALNSLVDMLQFVQYQLFIESKKFKYSACKLQKINEELERDLKRQSLQIRTQTSHADAKIRDLENKLSGRERELTELKDAYKEKLRKCNAWEKAYSNLRDQLDCHTNTAFTKQAFTNSNCDRFENHLPQELIPLASPPEKMRYSDIDKFASDAVANHYDRPRRSENDNLPKMTRRTEVTTFRSFHPYERQVPPEDTMASSNEINNDNFREILDSSHTKLKPSFLKSNSSKIQNRKSLF